jgi:hypothetical protein
MVNPNYYQNNEDVPWATATKAETLAPSDASDTSDETAKGLLVVAAGNLEIHAKDSAAPCAAFAVTAGQHIPICCKLVRTGTTATVIGLA